MASPLPGASPGGFPAASPGARLLVIDDEPAVGHLLSQALTDAGYQVETAGDGRAGIDKIRATRFDLVLCDLSMPGLGGLETIGKIRAIDPDLPVIVITAHGTVEGAIESLRQNVFDFLQKPLLLEDVRLSVARALERRDLVERVGLYDLSRSIFETLDPDELYGRIEQSARRVLRADDVSLMLLDGNGELFIAHSTSLGDEILEATRLAMGERIAGRVALQAEPTVINEDVARDPRFAGVRPLRPIRAAIVCPLTMRGGLLGVLNISRVEIAEPYAERDRRNATILASLVALALGNARLHKELETRLEQLREAQDELIQQEKMTALGGMLSGVAHELNNPLCSVLGYAQLLSQAEVDARTRKGIEVILRETDRASRIVANLLRFARRERPEPRVIDVNDVLTKALERKAPDLKICGIRVQTRLDRRLPPIVGDPRQLTTALTNLIHNAQQAMFEHRGEGLLRVSSAARDAAVTVSIADDGPGIAEEHLRRVFDPFFTTKAVGKGTGLGLSVAFAIVRDHGGTIRALPGKTPGVTFVVELPIPAPEALRAAESAASAAGPGRTGAPAGTAGPCVLVAEPDPKTAGLLEEILGSMGYLAETAADRGAVLERLEAGEYQALIADAAMPDLEGHQLLEALRARHPLLARRVIFLAADARDAGALAFVASSGTMMVGKPLDPSTLRAALRRLLASTLVDEAPVRPD